MGQGRGDSSNPGRDWWYGSHGGYGVRGGHGQQPDYEHGYDRGSGRAPRDTDVYDFEENAVLAWNEQALDVIRFSLDDNRPDASLLLGVQSLAVYDTLNAINDRPGFIVDLDAPDGVDVDAAIAGAAHRVLSFAFPEDKRMLDRELREALESVPDGEAESASLAFGQSVADAILAEHGEGLLLQDVSYAGSEELGKWRPTPPDYLPGVEPQHDEVLPFALVSPSQLRPEGPPDLSGEEYAAALEEVQRLGGRHSPERSSEQTEIAKFWANDFDTYTPSGHINEIVANIAADQNLSVDETGLLFAQLNAAIADSIIACWESKYYFDFWRPITAIRSAGIDGNPATDAEKGWKPLLENPNHPEYASGHAVMAGAAEVILTEFFGDIPFSATSEDLPGVVRNFADFHEMAYEAAESRIFGGVHFRFSMEDGLAMGREVAEVVLSEFGAPQTSLPNDEVTADFI